MTGPNETKTMVHGSINGTKKQISFRETRIVYSKTTDENTDFCFIHAQLKAAKVHGTTVLKGGFTGYKADGKTECGKGKIMLASAQDVLDRLLKIAGENKIPKPERADTPKKAPHVEIVYEKEVDDSKVQKVLPGATVQFPAPSPAVTIEVWDSKTIDGDIITLKQDDKVLLDNYTLSGQHKILSVNMGDKKSVTFTLIAVNEGSEPVNTARIKITSGSAIYYMDASTTMGKDVQIILNRTAGR
jgi:hypothetical protein